MSVTQQLRLCAKCGQHVRVDDGVAEPCPNCSAQSAGMESVELQGPAAGRLNALLAPQSPSGLSRRSPPSAASMAVMFTASAVSFTAACFGVDTPAYGLPFDEPEDIYVGDAPSDTVGDAPDASSSDEVSESNDADVVTDAEGSAATDGSADTTEPGGE